MKKQILAVCIVFGTLMSTFAMAGERVESDSRTGEMGRAPSHAVICRFDQALRRQEQVEARTAQGRVGAGAAR